MITIKFKKTHPNAVTPKQGYPIEEHCSDAGFDMTAINKHFDKESGCWVYDTGIAVEIPKGYVGLAVPRSSHRKQEYYLANSVGIIDSNYRGSIAFSYKHKNNYEAFLGPYCVGDKVGQLVIVPCPIVEFVEVDELSETFRSTRGHGSTGK